MAMVQLEYARDLIMSIPMSDSMIILVHKTCDLRMFILVDLIMMIPPVVLRPDVACPSGR